MATAAEYEPYVPTCTECGAQVPSFEDMDAHRAETGHVSYCARPPGPENLDADAS